MKHMSKRKVIILILSLVVLICMIATLLNLRGELSETVSYLKTANWFWLLLMIPNTILMFYCAGRIWHPYLKQYGIKAGELGKIQYELNFLSGCVPAGEISALVYSTERLKLYGVPAGLSGVMFIFRYIVSISTNLAGMILAVIILALMGKLSEIETWPLIVVVLMIIIVVVAFVLILAAITGKIHFKNAKIQGYVTEMNEALKVVLKDKKALVKSVIWGSLYTLFEDLPFLIVAAAFGVPQIFLQIIVAGVAGNFGQAIVPTPGGVGGFDAAMIWLMGGFGIEVGLAAVIVVVSRVVFLVGTIVTGYPFFQRGMAKISKTPTKKSP